MGNKAANRDLKAVGSRIAGHTSQPEQQGRPIPIKGKYPQRSEAMSEINVDENFDFRAWLKNFAPGNLDDIVKALSDWTKRTRKIKMVTPNLKLTAKLEV